MPNYLQMMPPKRVFPIHTNSITKLLHSVPTAHRADIAPPAPHGWHPHRVHDVSVSITLRDQQPWQNNFMEAKLASMQREKVGVLAPRSKTTMAANEGFQPNTQILWLLSATHTLHEILPGAQGQAIETGHGWYTNQLTVSCAFVELTGFRSHLREGDK